ncbi:MAG TPA: DUF1360 domain-containing protein [Thermoanaerobaculia bacterium]|nr:DUF1360 domain-containing protein [Thermoanaerobaculia bacterium]
MTVDYTAIPALVILALAVSAIAMSITQGTIFAPFRTWLAAKNHRLGELFACFFCLSHWVAFAAVAVFQPRPLRSGFYVADLVVSAFATIGLAVITSGIIFRVFLAAMAVHREREAKQAAAVQS